jgi:type I restriction enzyme M protein
VAIIRTVPKTKTTSSAATVGYEAQLWKMADALRGSMDAAEYKHVVLGLVFLKYISDAFEEQHGRLEAERARAQTPKTRTSSGASASFGSRPKRAGST